jgi:hypothetical protein
MRRVRDEIESHGGRPMPRANWDDAGILLAIILEATFVFWWFA